MDLGEDRFQYCVKEVIAHEGGLERDLRDPGGTTQWGISVRYLRAEGLDLNGDGVINDEDVVGIHLQDAVNIYRKFWWNRYHYVAFNELLVVEKVFDLAVNMGGYAAHKLLQIACNSFLIVKQPLTVDGIIGGNTIRVANMLNPIQLRQQLRECAKQKYEAILHAHPNMEWARNGWMNRAAW